MVRSLASAAAELFQDAVVTNGSSRTVPEVTYRTEIIRKLITVYGVNPHKTTRKSRCAEVLVQRLCGFSSVVEVPDG